MVERASEGNRGDEITNLVSDTAADSLKHGMLELPSRTLIIITIAAVRSVA